MDIYKWKWKALGALRCLNNADLKNSKRKHCARCVYYLSEITTSTRNFRNTYSYVLIDLEGNPATSPQQRCGKSLITPDSPCVNFDIS